MPWSRLSALALLGFGLGAGPWTGLTVFTAYAALALAAVLTLIVRRDA